jgi:hypothetical protein
MSGGYLGYYGLPAGIIMAEGVLCQSERRISRAQIPDPVAKKAGGGAIISTATIVPLFGAATPEISLNASTGVVWPCLASSPWFAPGEHPLIRPLPRAFKYRTSDKIFGHRRKASVSCLVLGKEFH